MRLQEVKQCKEECEIVIQKLARIAKVIVNVGRLCESRNLGEEDLPACLRAILDSLQRFVSSATLVPPDSHDLTKDQRIG